MSRPVTLFAAVGYDAFVALVAIRVGGRHPIPVYVSLYCRATG